MNECKGFRMLTQAFLAALLLGPASSSADEIADATGIKGGLVVHLGCGDGKRTAALLVNDKCLVHGLDQSAANVQTARDHIRSLGLYGKVSIDQFDGKRLPYTDNLVNLVVASGECRVASEEIARVLAPGGAALFLNRQSKIGNGSSRGRRRSTSGRIICTIQRVMRWLTIRLSVRRSTFSGLGPRVGHVITITWPA